MSKKECELSFLERQMIEIRIRGRWSFRRIGILLDRDHTVISREVKRNTVGGARYCAIKAHTRADHRKKKKKKCILDYDEFLRVYVFEQLNLECSPEQIAGRLKKYPPSHLAGKRISYETIYKYVYAHAPEWYHYLRRKKRPQRQKRNGRKTQKNTKIPERISIHERPEIINARTRIGDFESDTVVFKKQKDCLSVQYERSSQLMRMHKLKNRSAEETEIALEKTIDSLPSDLMMKSITFDNGGEGAGHLNIRNKYHIGTYFCDTYSSWQKGGVENINGLIRQYLPRETILATMTDRKIFEIQERLNNRPRKKLNYLTPNEFVKLSLIKSGAIDC